MFELSAALVLTSLLIVKYKFFLSSLLFPVTMDEAGIAFGYNICDRFFIQRLGGIYHSFMKKVTCLTLACFCEKKLSNICIEQWKGYEIILKYDPESKRLPV